MAARGPKNPGARFSEKKPPVFFLKFFGPATPLWVLEPSVIMHLVSMELLLASAVFARSIKVLRCQPGAPQFREHDFPKKKNPVFFEIHRTINTSMGSAALPNHAFGLYGTLSSQSSVYKVN